MTQTGDTQPIRGASASGLPPGPRLPAAVQTAWFVREPIGFLERCRSRYGPVFRVRIVSEPRLVYVAEPGLARRVFGTDREGGGAGDARREFLEPLVGAHSVLCLEGEEWLAERKLLGPVFHGGRVAGYREQIAALTAAEVATWSVDEPFALRPRMQALTLEVIIRVVFGIRDAQRLSRLRALLPPLLDGGHWLMIWALPVSLRRRIESSGLLRRLPGNLIARFQDLRDELDRVIYEEIAHRRSQDGGGDDALSLLLRAHDDQGAGRGDVEVRDELVTLITAGHETTATALAWAFERLLRAPRVLKRLVAEVAAGEDEYLDAVVKEVLRVRPPVLDAPRTLAAPLRLDGYEVPAGWMVAPAIPLVNTDPGSFPDPYEFRPERFLEDDPPFGAWIPFGGGRRRCLGSQLALLEIATVMREVLRRVRLEAPDPAPEAQRVRHVTLVPSELTRVVARPVAAPPAAPMTTAATAN